MDGIDGAADGTDGVVDGTDGTVDGIVGTADGTADDADGAAADTCSITTGREPTEGRTGFGRIGWTAERGAALKTLQLKRQGNSSRLGRKGLLDRIALLVDGKLNQIQLHWSVAE